ncbi:hypothetical protein QOT17_019945 [Balamuthia mandrillaris]
MDSSATPDLSAASFCLTFLERFPGCTGYSHTNAKRRGEETGGETPLEEEEEDEPGVWDLTTANAFELRFLEKAGPALKRYLKEEECLQVVLINRSEKEAGLVMNPSEDKEKSNEDEKEAEDRHLLALAQQDGVLVTKNRLLQLTQGLHQLFLTPNIFDYDAIVKRITDSVVKIVSRLCPFFDATDLSNIYTKPTVPFGEEWSVYIDISFEGGGDRGNLVAYPNAYRFPPRLVEAWQSTAHRKDCIYRDFYFRCFAAPPHEVVHCLQAKAKQLDSNPLFWSAEHDASFLAGRYPFLSVSLRQALFHRHCLFSLLNGRKVCLRQWLKSQITRTFFPKAHSRNTWWYGWTFSSTITREFLLPSTNSTRHGGMPLAALRPPRKCLTLLAQPFTSSTESLWKA